VLARNPRAVMVTVSAFGCDGPWAGRPGGGSLAEAFGGLTYLTGESDGPPMLPSLPLGDSLTGLAGVIGVLAACWGRDVRGAPGQHVDVAMYEPIITLLGSLVPAWTPGEPSRPVTAAVSSTARRATSTNAATARSSSCPRPPTPRSPGCYPCSA